jgi:thymidylate synthase (FAD)
MEVVLLNHTPNPERAIAAAARLCYAPVGAAELMEDMSDETVRRVLRTIITSGHTSALEHASYTFAIEGVSRALTHQLVRHRLASYNQQSQRYVVPRVAPAFVVPPSITTDGNAREIYTKALRDCFECYRDLVSQGIPAEDARYILPNAAPSNIVVTMNIRELLHFLTLRCCKRAQWEIRELALLMLGLATPTAPYIFKDAGANCRRGSCTEGRMTCGDPYPRVVRTD